jgi:hypothetical protein
MKTRTAIIRRTPIGHKCRQCGEPLDRPVCQNCGAYHASTVPPVNRARARDRKRKNFGARAEAVREMRCLVDQDCQGPVCAAHATSRGAGGDRFDLVPLCNRHHHEQHAHGILTFESRHFLSLREEADRIAVELSALGYE